MKIAKLFFAAACATLVVTSMASAQSGAAAKKEVVTTKGNTSAAFCAQARNCRGPGGASAWVRCMKSNGYNVQAGAGSHC